MDVRNLPGVVKTLKNHIAASNIEFDAIAFRGMSGALVAPLLALAMKKGIIVCRKPTEESHGYPVEGYHEGGKYIIVDDFIDCGITVRDIMETIDRHVLNYNSSDIYDEGIGGFRARLKSEQVPEFDCVGIFLYRKTQADINRYSSTYPDSKYNITHKDNRVPVFGTLE